MMVYGIISVGELGWNIWVASDYRGCDRLEMDRLRQMAWCATWLNV